MRTKLLLTVSVAALCSATSAFADSAPLTIITGSIEAGLSYGSETAGMESEFWMENIGAQIEFGLGGTGAGQLEVFASNSGATRSSWFGEYGGEMGLQTYGATLHLNWAVDNFRVGPFLMLESTTVGDHYYDSLGAGPNVYLAFGGEARWMAAPDFDISGRIGGLFHLASPDGGVNCGPLCDAFFAGGGATWFIDDNNALSANFDYIGGQGGHVFFGRTIGQTGWDYGARFEHQFDDSPFAAYIAYDGNSFAWDGYLQHDNVVSVGVKFYFNGDTLRKQHDAGGFRTPHFERMINQSLSGMDAL